MNWVSGGRLTGLWVFIKRGPLNLRSTTRIKNHEGVRSVLISVAGSKMNGPQHSEWRCGELAALVPWPLTKALPISRLEAPFGKQFLPSGP
jgi:hypothetical protein